MRTVSSARSSCLCWKERCIETEYIVIILLPTSVFLSTYKGSVKRVLVVCEYVLVGTKIPGDAERENYTNPTLPPPE